MIGKKTDYKTIGIVAHSFEGGALCFQTACREGCRLIGPHMHPGIVLSAIPLGLSMPGWENHDYASVAGYLRKGVEQVASAGADFFICPDNTAHIVLNKTINDLPLPGLSIADVVCHAIKSQGFKNVGLLGTKWTMTGPVYKEALEQLNLMRLIPGDRMREKLNDAIFEKLCVGIFDKETTQLFVDAISDLKLQGADCVILGCTEIPLIISPENSPLPILDSTRLLATYAVSEALSAIPLVRKSGWLQVVQSK